MYEKRNEADVAEALAHPLKSLTRAQFAALGGDAVAYIRPVNGALLSTMIHDAQFDDAADYQLVMSADGTPLLVTDSEDGLHEWLGDQNLGLATLH